MDLLFILFFFIAIVVFFLPLFFHLKFPEPRWNWNKIEMNNISFPKSFVWGTATAAHQVEGNCQNNWSEFENGQKNDGTPNIKDAQISDNACEHWDR